MASILRRRPTASAWTVEEAARVMGIEDGSPLMKALRQRRPALLSANQAASCLGRGLHVGVARAIVRRLLGDGTLSVGLTYGSAFSGIDMFAAAVEAEPAEEERETEKVPRLAGRPTLRAFWSASRRLSESCGCESNSM